MTSAADYLGALSPASAQKQQPWQAWQRSDVKETSKHRRQRRQRAGDRILAQVAASCVRLQAHRASEVPVPLRPLLQFRGHEEMTMLALEGLQARILAIGAAMDSTLSSWSEEAAAEKQMEAAAEQEHAAAAEAAVAEEVTLQPSRRMGLEFVEEPEDEASLEQLADFVGLGLSLSDIMPSEYPKHCLDTKLIAKARYLAALPFLVDTDLVSCSTEDVNADYFRVVYDKGLPVTTTLRRDSPIITKLALGTEVVLQRADAPIELEGRIRARIHTESRSHRNLVSGWITMRSLDPSYHFVQPIETQRQHLDDDISVRQAQSLRDVSFVNAPFENRTALVIKVWAESADHSEREFMALVRSGKSKPLQEVARAILKFLELQLPTPEEPLHYQAMFSDLTDNKLSAEELSAYAYKRLRLMIFIHDPRDATLDFA